MTGMWYYTLLPKIWNMSLTASVVILFVLLARLLLRRAPKVFSYALWIVVLFRLLCPVSFPSGLSLFSLVNAPVSGQNTLEYIPPDIVHTEDPEVDLPLPGVSAAGNQTLPYGEEQLAAVPLEAPVAIATWVWLFGIAGMLTYSVISLLRQRRKLVGSALLQDNIRLADQISSPFVMGLFRPKIYLPSSLPGSERDYIILHEQTHIRRGDHIVKLLAFAALCIHWFNPLVWVAFILSGKDMEMSCDEAVLRKLGPEIRGAYSQSLLNLATGRRFIAGTPLAFGEGDTRSRVKNALNWKKPAAWVVAAAVILCAAVILVCALNPKEEETLAPEPFGNSYSAEELVYADGRFSFVITPESAPIYRFTEDHEFLYREKETSYHAGSGWNTVGGLTEVELTKSTFDTFFHETGIGIWTDGYSAAALRRNNQKAWQNLSQEGGFSYYLLLQKNGEVFLAYWHNGENGENQPLSDDSYVRFLLKLTKRSSSQDFDPVGGADGPTEVFVQADPLDIAAEIEQFFDTMDASPAWSSNPGDYINAHPDEYQALLDYGDDTLRYIYAQFFAGGQTDLKGHLMRIVMCELLGGEAIDLDAATGQEYFDAWLADARSIREARGDAYLQEHMPKTWLLLETVDQILSAASFLYLQ